VDTPTYYTMSCSLCLCVFICTCWCVSITITWTGQVINNHYSLSTATCSVWRGQPVSSTANITVTRRLMCPNCSAVQEHHSFTSRTARIFIVSVLKHAQSIVCDSSSVGLYIRWLKKDYNVDLIHFNYCVCLSFFTTLQAYGLLQPPYNCMFELGV